MKELLQADKTYDDLKLSISYFLSLKKEKSLLLQIDVKTVTPTQVADSEKHHGKFKLSLSCLEHKNESQVQYDKCEFISKKQVYCHGFIGVLNVTWYIIHWDNDTCKYL